MAEQRPDLVEIPADLTLVSEADLRSLEAQAVAEYTAIRDSKEPPTAQSVQRAMHLTDGVQRLRSEIKIREQRARDAKAREDEALQTQMANLDAKIGTKQEAGADTGGGVAVLDPPITTEQIVAAAAQGAAAAVLAAQGRTDSAEVVKRISTSLAEASKHAPTVTAPRQPLTVTAAMDIPGVAHGTLSNLDDLVDAVHKRAKSLGVTQTGRADGPLVATIRNEFEHTVDDRTAPGTIEELHRFLTSPDKQDALVAGGGWCAPSEIRYDFFNVACEDGLVDLPTVGISRGGIQFPTSPSLADVQLAPFVSGFSNQSNPWLWTETDDQATVTGTPNKPCIRVPCPSFTERRLECYGVCLTAGNLTNDAYPEATSNFLRLLMAAHSHAMNARILATMQTLSSAATTLAGGTDNAYNSLLGGINLAAVDYRARYGMCADDILEVVIPYWVLYALQSDLAWHAADNSTLSVSLATIRGYFADRGVRVQFVGDWQTRGAPAGTPGGASALTAWPTTVDVMMYAAGTFLLGNGLTLDLGVVRDSVLNADNDYTAAWSEECHLVARVGHESRRYTITFNVGGNYGVTVATTPGL